ncbi:MAG: polyhydroxyalkanoate depolymerase [Alphaproteobacteria bacterium]|nr:polyhydroxyalkanoate depolymerase [Alphaproteobacteria bacterium]MBV8547917.1 polyhydroxyalkanoate depolymerase [Alphaproteobacteria bacterium]
MLLYHLHDWQRAAMAPFRIAAEATQAAFHNPFFPATYTHFGRAVAAGAELVERTTRQFGKPAFGLHSTVIAGDTVKVEEEVVLTKPFCKLLHFKRHTDRVDPIVLVVAPMSGHYATLLRGTVEALLPEHDVYITDWVDAKMVPLSHGKFDLEDYITYVMDCIRHLGAQTHLIAVCQPAVPVMCAVALLAQMGDPAQPRSMTLMGGPIDTSRAKTVVTELADKRPIEWFQNTVIHAIPFYYPGGHRLVYPGFVQLNGFVSMNVERHVGEHMKLFRNLVKGDEESATAHRTFYDEYLAVMDVTAEFYLQTVERVFQKRDLANGTFTWNGQRVDPSAIRRTALLTVEGELDDISAPGQTIAAHDLCSGLADDMRQAHLQIGVGHYGIFNGRKWRTQILPIVHQFMLDHDAAPENNHPYLRIVDAV